jgi:hypothetical protein
VNPYLGAVVVVNVDAAHNNGQPHAPALVTAVNPDGTVNVRVSYDAPPPEFSHRHREHLTGIAFHDTADPAAANVRGLYGAFWPQSPLQQEIATILENQEIIMAAQDDITAAAAAITNASTVISTVTADLGTVQTEIQNALTAFQADNPAVDTTALNTAVAGLSEPLSALQAADTALDTAASSAASAAGTGTPAPAEPADPASGTAGSTVNAGDTGSAA